MLRHCQLFTVKRVSVSESAILHYHHMVTTSISHHCAILPAQMLNIRHAFTSYSQTSKGLLVLKCVSFFLNEFCELLTTGYRSFSRYMSPKYFLIICDLSFPLI